MLKGNLSTRPFYNERLVTIGLFAVALLALALSVFNVRKLISLSSQRSELQGQISRDTAAADQITNDAATLRRTVDSRTLQGLAAETREANLLIDQRTFSWTALFGVIEKTLPIDVRVVAVSPKIDKGDIQITMIVVARRQGDLSAFIDALEKTGTFYDVLPHAEQQNDDGSYNATLEAYYLPPGATKAPAAVGKGRS